MTKVYLRLVIKVYLGLFALITFGRFFGEATGASWLLMLSNDLIHVLGFLDQRVVLHGEQTLIEENCLVWVINDCLSYGRR